MACMDNPRIFVTKLRDYNLVPEDKFQVSSAPCIGDYTWSAWIATNAGNKKISPHLCDYISQTPSLCA